MKNNIKILKLVENGFKAQNLMSMSEKSVDALYKRLKEQIKPVTSTETKYEIGDQGGSLPPSPKGYTVKKSSDGKVMAEPNEGEMSEEGGHGWGSSDQGYFNRYIHEYLGKPNEMPSPFDSNLEDAASEAVDYYWDDWEEYETDRKGLIDHAKRGYLRSYFKEKFDMLVKMFEPAVEDEELEDWNNEFGDDEEIYNELDENITSSNALGDLAMQKLTGQETPHDEDDMAPDGMDDDSDNNRSEMQEKAVSKQQQKFFGVVKSMQDGDTPKKGKAGEVAKEMSKKDVMDFVKTKHKGLPKKKETKENYLDMVGKAFNNNMKNKISDIRPGLTFESKVEKELTRIVEKHLPTKISKKDFINLVSESPEIAPSKPKVKPGTKPNRPSTPYSPKPGPKPAPKAKGNNSPGIAPSKPTIKPGTKPNRPSTPYKPKPGPKPAPKAGNENSNIPEWLSFNKLGIELK
jgi:hypothetical protein